MASRAPPHPSPRTDACRRSPDTAGELAVTPQSSVQEHAAATPSPACRSVLLLPWLPAPPASIRLVELRAEQSLTPGAGSGHRRRIRKPRPHPPPPSRLHPHASLCLSADRTQNRGEEEAANDRSRERRSWQRPEQRKKNWPETPPSVLFFFGRGRPIFARIFQEGRNSRFPLEASCLLRLRRPPSAAAAMGVKNLWDILDSCKKKLPLQHLQNKKVCVDLSCWLVQFCSAHRSPAFLRDKVYLKNLFHRLRALLALNCSLIFVSDGAIPSVKLATYRRRLGLNTAEAAREEANSQPLTSLRRNKSSEFSRMIKEAKHLGLALGIPCLDGVEEAEAQCALLNFSSLCDGCFTSDSDSFLFGARTVYRDVFIGEGGYVICYEMEDIQKKLGFGRNSLISLALLLGSDYSNGVHGFGPELACRLVKSVGDDAILDQILSDGVKPTRKCNGKNSGANAGRVGGTCLKESTCEVGINQDSGGQFRDIINAYLEPKCHSPDSEAVQRACSQRPFLRTQLQQICEQYFEWSPVKTDEYILPKIAERELRRFSNLRSTSSDLGVKPSLDEMPVPCPVLAIVKQRKVQGSEYYEVSWRNIDGLQVSVVPGDLVRSACPEKITDFLENKDAQKKQKRRARPKKSGHAAAAVKDVDAQLQELLLGIESESSTFPCTASGPQTQTANIQMVAPLQDFVDLSSPSPPIRCKIARSRKLSDSDAVTMDGIDLQHQSLLIGSMESKGNTVLCDVKNSALDHEPIDLSSPSPCAAHKPQAALGRPPLCMEAERRALWDISNLPDKEPSCCKHESGTSGCDVHVEESTLVRHGTGMPGEADSSRRRSDGQTSEVVEPAMIDLSSPSPVKVDNSRRNDKKPDHDCEADSIHSPEHEKKARELRLFLNSIRDEL